ncbi:MAG: type II secretion system protein [Alphaproteobacteria bacterium]
MTQTYGKVPQTTTSCHSAQSGRTLLEMMAVLAIMGILSVSAYYFFRTSMDKHLANTIVEDAQVAYMDLHSRAEGVPPTWEEVTQQFKVLSENILFYVKRDPLQNDYVKVTGIEKRVCAHLLNMQAEGKLTFYTEGDEKYTECLEENNMVLAFNGQVAPAECRTASDCDKLGDYGAEGFQGYCTSAGRCLECDATYETINYDRTACECLPGLGLSCQNAKGVSWCCGPDLICGTELNSCISGGGLCSYHIYGDYDPDIFYQTECSYSMSDIEDVEGYDSDCYYELGANPAPTTKPIGNQERTYSQPLMTASATRGGCPKNKYCSLFWSDKADGAEDGHWNEKPSTILADYTGRIYGKCQILSSYDPNPKMTYTPGKAFVYASGGARGGCPENRYCSLFWSQESWTGEQPKLPADSKGPFYGKCQPMNVYDPSPLLKESGAKAIPFRVLQGCPMNEYCYLKWQENSCTDHSASDTGVFSGVCTKMSTNKATCPYQDDSE